MPTVGLVRDDLFARLGKVYTQDEFELLCFEFGVELDEVTSEAEMVGKEQGEAAAKDLSETVIYKIDVPANRYDLLCMEGIARSLRIFLGLEPAPTYTPIEPAGGRLTMTVEPETARVRPYCVCAVLRGLDFTDKKVYDSFIDLQDKLHQNICRRRTYVAIGTHDLATLKPPFRYRALAPDAIAPFVPLTETTRAFGGRELLDHYLTDPNCKHLKPYVPIIYDAPVYPIIYDADDVVLSLPPIINSRHSRIQPTTRDVFIECTATDITKANIVLDTVVTMFSEYCTPAKFSVEPVDVVYASATAGVKAIETTPQLSQRTVEASMRDIRTLVGVPELTPERVCALLEKMQLGPAEPVPGAAGGDGAGGVRATVPPTRSDIIHAVDVIEDVAIAYGFNNLPLRVPKTSTVGLPHAVNQFTDLLRDEVARAGYTEMLTHGLCSRHENFKSLRRPDGPAVELLNPANEEYQVVRTTLLPGALKTLHENNRMAKRNGVKLFEISDVVLLDKAVDVGARNERHLLATYTGLTAGFEVIHGLLDRVMTCANVPPTAAYAADSLREEEKRGALTTSTEKQYYIKPSTEPTFFGGRCASVMLVREGEGEVEVRARARARATPERGRVTTMALSLSGSPPPVRRAAPDRLVRHHPPGGAEGVRARLPDVGARNEPRTTHVRAERARAPTRDPRPTTQTRRHHLESLRGFEARAAGANAVLFVAQSNADGAQRPSSASRRHPAPRGELTELNDTSP